MQLLPGSGTGTVGAPVTVICSRAGFTSYMVAGLVTGVRLADVVARRTSDGALQVFAGNDMGGLIPESTVAGTATWATWTTWPL